MRFASAGTSGTIKIKATRVRIIARGPLNIASVKITVSTSLSILCILNRGINVAGSVPDTIAPNKNPIVHGT